MPPRARRRLGGHTSDRVKAEKEAQQAGSVTEPDTEPAPEPAPPEPPDQQQHSTKRKNR